MSLVVTSDTTRSELAETLALLNVDAKELSRRGYTGTRGAEYTRIHDIINEVLTDLELATP